MWVSAILLKNPDWEFAIHKFGLHLCACVHCGHACLWLATLAGISFSVFPNAVASLTCLNFAHCSALTCLSLLTLCTGRVGVCLSGAFWERSDHLQVRVWLEIAYSGKTDQPISRALWEEHKLARRVSNKRIAGVCKQRLHKLRICYRPRARLTSIAFLAWVSHKLLTVIFIVITTTAQLTCCEGCPVGIVSLRKGPR